MDGFDPRVALALLLGATLLAAGVEDARFRNIANHKTLLIALLAPLWWWANSATLWPGVATQIGIAVVTFAVFAAAFHIGAMGGGDVKLITALSLWLPPGVFVGMLVAMSLIGGAVTLVMMIEHRMKRGGPENRGQIEVPYGVAIAAAGLLALHEPILNQFG
jgi:prepilin peptidase CpaA